jgi:hypothetical protein
VFEDSLWVVGGLDKDARMALNTVSRFDGVRWRSCPPLDQPRIQCAAAVFRGCLWVVGGEGSSADEFLSSTERFDGQAWVRAAVPPRLASVCVFSLQPHSVSFAQPQRPHVRSLIPPPPPPILFPTHDTLSTI